ncbi:MAG: excinuclease ABC subunit UvrB [Kiritimatiellae bacterium]|nr:excinuclease ABC subunit UvrB [Kiritimatiellia bacterium]
MPTFKLHSKYRPTGDQPHAIDALVDGLKRGLSRQTLQGVTGSGKTFTMANIIARAGRPALIISHNKTLAAQLYAEFKEFFPENAVEYFISYYDYYQPEAYIPQTDTYIEKDAQVNDEIERLRLSATNSLLSRDDVIVVASVSCIYGLGDPVDYAGMIIHLAEGEEYGRDKLLSKLVELQYKRNDIETAQGTFRVRGDIVDIFPAYREDGLRVEFFGDTVDSLRRFDPLTMKMAGRTERAIVSPAKQFVMPHDKLLDAIPAIEEELSQREEEFKSSGKLLELQRLDQRTRFDLEMLRQHGYCSGIENYSRHLGGRAAGTPPPCLIDYFQKDFLTLIDESHVTIPQLRAMFNGDQARKRTLIEHGFRLPSASDNRPLAFDEFEDKIGDIIFVSATPGPYERQTSGQTVEQVIRPTGLLDPPVEVRPLKGQIDDVMAEIRATAAAGDRTLVTTLTKRTSEDLTQYLSEAGLRVEYLHSGIEALERVEILGRLRRGEFDCLVGINLLREGLDLPEVALVAVLDADKEGFLRSDTSLIQTAGRAARHERGRVILYAETVTDSMRRMMEITESRRRRQIAYNAEHGITPRSVQSEIKAPLAAFSGDGGKSAPSGGAKSGKRGQKGLRGSPAHDAGYAYDIQAAISQLRGEMLQAAEELDFETAAALRDQIRELERQGN